jgi:membrane-associated protein
MGPLLFSKPDSRFFKRAHLEKAHAFYEKHGSKTIVLARFVPIVRTFAPTVAGAAGMDYKQFIGYNIAGGVLWICSMLLGGYFLGHFIPADKLDKVVIVIVFISILPMIIHAVQEKRAAKREASARIRTGEGEAA